MVKLTRAMQNTIVHNEGATSLEGAVGKVKLSGSLIKLGLDIHAKQYVRGLTWLPIRPCGSHRRFRLDRAKFRFSRQHKSHCAPKPFIWKRG